MRIQWNSLALTMYLSNNTAALELVIIYKRLPMRISLLQPTFTTVMSGKRTLRLERQTTTCYSAIKKHSCFSRLKGGYEPAVKSLASFSSDKESTALFECSSSCQETKTTTLLRK